MAEATPAGAQRARGDVLDHARAVLVLVAVGVGPGLAALVGTFAGRLASLVARGNWLGRGPGPRDAAEPFANTHAIPFVDALVLQPIRSRGPTLAGGRVAEHGFGVGRVVGGGATNLLEARGELGVDRDLAVPAGLRAGGGR